MFKITVMKNTYTNLSAMLFIICLTSLLLLTKDLVAQQKIKRSFGKMESIAIENKCWQLISLNGKMIKGTSYTHYLILHTQDAFAETKVGCNQLRYLYELNNKGLLHFKNGTTTLMACPNQEMEELYRKALLRTKRYVVNKQQLFLIGADKKILAIFQLVPIENGHSFVGKTFVQEGASSYDPLLGGAPFLKFESKEKASLKLGDIVERMNVQFEDGLIRMRSEFHPHPYLFKIVNNEVLLDENGITWVLKNK